MYILNLNTLTRIKRNKKEADQVLVKDLTSRKFLNTNEKNSSMEFARSGERTPGKKCWR